MPETQAFLKLTNEGAFKVLNKAVEQATLDGVPECIAIVDPGGHLLAFTRMDGAFTQSIDSAIAKARTAASFGVPTGYGNVSNEIKLQIASKGERVNLFGGLPIIVDGHVIGAIGIGSATGEEDLALAKIAITALEGAQRFD
jgi:glc operon protein GlcG